MKVRFSLSAIGLSKWYEHVSRFVFGGAMTAVVGIIAKQYGPVVGGLFLAFPAIFPASASLIEKHERVRKENRGLPAGKRGGDAAALDASGASIGAVALIVFAFVVWKCVQDYSAPLVIVCDVLIWFAVSVVLWKATETLKIRRRPR